MTNSTERISEFFSFFYCWLPIKTFQCPLFFVELINSNLWKFSDDKNYLYSWNSQHTIFTHFDLEQMKCFLSKHIETLSNSTKWSIKIQILTFIQEQMV
jgi:hypothetical protein